MTLKTMNTFYEDRLREALARNKELKEQLDAASNSNVDEQPDFSEH